MESSTAKKEIAYGIDMMTVKIEPIKPIIFAEKASVVLGIKPIGGKLKTNHNFYYAFYSADGDVQFEGNMLLEGEDYAKWADDDNYVFECLLKVLPQVKVITEEA